MAAEQAEQLEGQLEDIAIGRRAKSSATSVNGRGSVLLFPLAIANHVAGRDGQPGREGISPIRVWRLDTTTGQRAEQVMPGTPVPATFYARFEWETVHSGSSENWRALTGSFVVQSGEVAAAPPAAHLQTAYVVDRDGHRSATDIPAGLESQTLSPMRRDDLLATLAELVELGEAARRDLVVRMQPYIHRVLDSAFNASPHAFAREDLHSEANVVLLEAIEVCSGPQRPGTTFPALLSKRIKGAMPRITKPAGVHEGVVRRAAFARQYDHLGPVTAERLEIDYLAHTNNVTPEVAASRVKAANLKLSSKALVAAQQRLLTDVSMESLGEAQDSGVYNDTYAPQDAAAEAAHNPLDGTSLDTYIDIADRQLLPGADYPDAVVVAPGLLLLSLQPGTGKWTPSLFRDDAMIGFKHALEPMTVGLNWGNQKQLAIIRRIITTELRGNGHALPAEQVEAAWRERLTSQNFAGRTTLTADARARCLDRGADLAHEAGLPLVAAQLAEAASSPAPPLPRHASPPAGFPSRRATRIRLTA